MSALFAVSHEHHERILAHVDRLPILADMVSQADPADFAAQFEPECHFILNNLLPHMDAIEATLYGELERLMGDRHSLKPMREEHEHLRRLIRSLCVHRAQIASGDVNEIDGIGLRRILYRLYTMLKVHLAEEELYLQIIDRNTLSEEERDALVRGIDHAVAEPL